MATSRSWWHMLVGGDARWWRSVVPEFFVRRGWEKSLPSCLALTRCRLWVTPFLLGGRCGNPLCTVLYIPGETLGPVRSGQQRHFDSVLLPEGTAWYGTLQNAWSMVGKDGGCNDCGSSLFCHFAFVVISFFLGMFCYCPSIPLDSNCCIDVVAILI
jgi:hypothetical protein